MITSYQQYKMKTVKITATGLMLAISCAVQALDIPGANGTDGVFNPTKDVEIDLGLAAAGSWNGPNLSPTNGVYDQTKWAIIFRYSRVEIPTNVTVTFKNHFSRAPVVWLVSGDVSIRGKVDISGRPLAGKLTEPGPGGFRGGPAYGGLGLV